MKKHLLIASAFIGFIHCAIIMAGEKQSIDSIAKAAKAHIIKNTMVLPYQSFEISAVQIDKRLRLEKCQHKLQTFSPTQHRQGQQRTVGISCNLPKSWKIYVPVKTTLKTPVLISKNQLNPGDIIHAEDLTTQVQSVSHLSYGYYDQANKVIGQKVKTMISSGTVLTPRMLKAATVIKRGQIVTITAKLGGINISAQGKALMDGSSGDTIRVKNTSSGKIIEGSVSKDGTVLINM